MHSLERYLPRGAAQRNATADVSELSTAARFMRRPRAVKVMLIAILIPHAVRVDQPCDMV